MRILWLGRRVVQREDKLPIDAFSPLKDLYPRGNVPFFHRLIRAFVRPVRTDLSSGDRSFPRSSLNRDIVDTSSTFSFIFARRPPTINNEKADS